MIRRFLTLLNKTLPLIILTAIVCSGMLLGACSSQKAFKVGFIYPGQVALDTFCALQDRGRLAIESEELSSMVAENIQSEKALRTQVQTMAKAGCQVLFLSEDAALYPSSVLEALIGEYPQVHFVLFDSQITAKNASSYSVDLSEAAYLSGILSAEQSQSKKLGFISLDANAQSNLALNAFAAGALLIDEDVLVYGLWSNSRYDPLREENALQRVWVSDADICTGFARIPDMLLHSARVDRRCIAWLQYDAQAMDEVCIGAVTVDFAGYYRELITSLQSEEEYIGTHRTATIENGMVSFTASNSSSKALSVLSQIKAGDHILFKGPLKNQDGKELLLESQSFTNEEFMARNVYLENVVFP